MVISSILIGIFSLDQSFKNSNFSGFFGNGDKFQELMENTENLKIEKSDFDSVYNYDSENTGWVRYKEFIGKEYCPEELEFNFELVKEYNDVNGKLGINCLNWRWAQKSKISIQPFLLVLS